eukprot:ANDGO_01126.mRNA.1 variant
MASAAISAPLEEYLEEHAVSFYMEDAISLILAFRVSNAVEFLSDYFSAVSNGTNVFHREFAYVSATRRNRVAFLAMFEHSFLLDEREEEGSKLAKSDFLASGVTAASFHSLATIICPDFPLLCTQVMFDATVRSKTCTLRQAFDAFGTLFVYAPFVSWILKLMKDDTRSLISRRDLFSASTSGSVKKMLSPLIATRFEAALADESGQSGLPSSCTVHDVLEFIASTIVLERNVFQSSLWMTLRKSVRLAYRDLKVRENTTAVAAAVQPPVEKNKPKKTIAKPMSARK